MANIIQAKNLSVHIDDCVLTNVDDFKISSGELVQLQGDNGSGKTSFLQSCAGIIPHITGGIVRGKLSIFGVDLSKSTTSTLQGKVVYIPSEVDLFFMNNTVLEELCFTLSGLDPKLSFEELSTKALAITNAFDIFQISQTPIAELSTGQRAKCAIICAIISQAKLLLLDEIMSSLDSSTRIEIENLIEQYVKGEASVIVADHDYDWKNAYRFSFNSSNTLDPEKENTGQREMASLQKSTSQGSLITIAGENGSGKTTLLRFIAGFVPKENLSKVNLELSESLNKDYEISKCKQKASRNNYSYMPQEVRHMFRNSKVSEDFLERTKDLPEDIVVQLELENLIDRDPTTLSFGQTKLCALGLAVSTCSKILLLDEPTRGLDHEKRKLVIDFLVRLCRENEIEIICATHDIELLHASNHTYELAKFMHLDIAEVQV